MIATIFSALVLLGAATGGTAAPQYSIGFYHHYLENAHYHHLHHHHYDDLSPYKEESSHNVEQEDAEAIRTSPAGLLLITQNPIGLCRTDNSNCSCLKEMSTKRFFECGDSYPVWTVDSLWQGTVPRVWPWTKLQPIDIQVCNEDKVSDSNVTHALNNLNEEERDCLRSVWPPLDSVKVGDCLEDSAIIYQGSIQGNCAHDYEQFQLDMYYRQVTDLYAKVNGASESCKMNARACSNRTSTPDADTVDISPPFPQPTYTPAFNERIHTALINLGLSNENRTTIDASALKGPDKFDKNVYLGCMKSGVGGINAYILTRVGFCFRCPNKGPCNNPMLVDCWTNAKRPPSTVPWAETNGDVPCYTGRKQVCYCGFDKLADCNC